MAMSDGSGRRSGPASKIDYAGGATSSSSSMMSSSSDGGGGGDGEERSSKSRRPGRHMESGGRPRAKASKSIDLAGGAVPTARRRTDMSDLAMRRTSALRRGVLAAACPSCDRVLPRGKALGLHPAGRHGSFPTGVTAAVSINLNWHGRSSSNP